MGMFDEDPQDAPALITQLGGDSPPLPPEMIAKMLADLQKRQTSRDVLGSVDPMQGGPTRARAPQGSWVDRARTMQAEGQKPSAFGAVGIPAAAITGLVSSLIDKPTDPKAALTEAGNRAMSSVFQAEPTTMSSEMRSRGHDPGFLGGLAVDTLTDPTTPLGGEADDMARAMSGAAMAGAVTKPVNAAREAIKAARLQGPQTLTSLLDAFLNPAVAAPVKAAAKAKPVPPVSLAERAPHEVIDERLLMSNRVPSAVTSPAMPHGQALMTGLPEVLATAGGPDKGNLVKSFAERLRDDPMIRPAHAAKSDESVVQKFIEMAQGNYEFLLEKMKPYAERSKLWYDGARQVASNIATEFGVHDDQASGVLAVLSPQKDWHQNAEEGRRLVRTFSRFSKEDPAFGPELANQFAKTSYNTLEESINEKARQGLSSQSAATLRAEYAATLQQRMQRMSGQRWSEMGLDDQAIMLRAFDELEYGFNYPILSPEGGIAHTVARNQPSKTAVKKGLEGEPSKLVWNQYADLRKALSILQDGSPENISRQLGNEHKVRSFFDNISQPNYGRQPGQRGPSTIDTHAVAGGHLLPMGAESPAVKYSMGGAANKQHGISGSNPLYQEAMSRTGAGAGLLPREAQSITWEGLKGLFSPSQKRDKGFDELLQRLWRDYNRGRSSLRSTQDAIYNEAGGIEPPAWAQPR